MTIKSTTQTAVCGVRHLNYKEMLQNLSLVLRRQFAKAATQAKPKEAQTQIKPLITCRRTQFNLLQHERGDAKFGTLPLCSKGWLHNKSKGDHFTLNATVSREQLQAEMQSLEQFLATGEVKLHEILLQNLQTDLGIKKLTGIQTQAIPIVDANFHALIAAETGCGKTLAYLLPVINRRLQAERHERKLNTPTVLILTPGRELATQISQIATKLCAGTDLKVKTLLGGKTKQLMLNPDFEEMDILVATLGAISKLVTTGVYHMDQVRHVVLDEADTLLDDSFTDKLCYFLRRFPVNVECSFSA